jgi:F-type H+-transporting ATPase subunit delta
MLLFDKGRIGYLREIALYYKNLADELKGIVKASITSATQLSSEAVEKIRDALSKRVGKSIVLDVQQDPSLIGGVVTKIGDLVLDGSVKTQLINMRETLKKGESV